MCTIFLVYFSNIFLLANFGIMLISTGFNWLTGSQNNPVLLLGAI